MATVHLPEAAPEQQRNDEVQNSPASDLDTKRGTALWEALTYLKERWELSDNNIADLVGVSRSTVQNWMNSQRVPYRARSNDIARLIHLIAVHRSLESMLETPEAQRSWLKVYRPDLGNVPYDLMASSYDGLLTVRQYLDYMRGRGA